MVTPDDDQRRSAIARIRKLLRMTVGNGCTEAEAIAAAEKAARLMAELGLRDGHVEFGADKVAVKSGWNSQRSRLWAEIALCTNTATILHDGDVEYIGREPWPEVATYLHRVTDRAITRELGAFKRTTWFKRRRTVKAKRAASADFTAAMVARLRTKLHDLFAPTMSDAAFTQAVAERDDRYPSASSVAVTRRKQSRYWDAALAGYAAGDDVHLSHGVATGGGAPALLGTGE